MSPFEALHGTKPDVKHFRTLGCICYSHIPKDERQKFDSKSNKCIFSGYGSETKGNKLFDISRNKILMSRDVMCNESENIFSEKENLTDDSPVIDESQKCCSKYYF